MIAFGISSVPPESALAHHLPEFRARELKLRGLAAVEGLQYGVADFGGLRTEADTAQALHYRDMDYAAYVARAKAAGRVPLPITGAWDDGKPRPIQPFGLSFHNFGAAADIVPTVVPAGMTFSSAQNRLGTLAGKAGLVWGGLWSGNSYDPRHVQLATGLAQVRDMWNQYQSGTLPTAPASPGAGIVIPGVQVVSSGPMAASGPVAAILPAIKSVASRVATAAHRAPLVTSAIGSGALIAVGLLTWLAVRRYLDDD